MTERAQELQLLKQIARQPCTITHSETIKIAHRLAEKAEAMLWPGYGTKAPWVLEITATGMATLRNEGIAD